MVFRMNLTYNEVKHRLDKEFIGSEKKISLPIEEVKEVYNTLNSLSPENERIDFVEDDDAIKSVMTKNSNKNQLLNLDNFFFHEVLKFTKTGFTKGTSTSEKIYLHRCKR